MVILTQKTLHKITVAMTITSLISLDAADSRELKRISRKKRYLTFPEGSAFSAAVCLTAEALGPAEIFTEAIAWGIAYDLPNDTSKFKSFLYPKPVMQRLHRRDLYRKMETLMTSMGIEGQPCILKALCETGQQLKKRRNNVFEEIIWTLFRFPLERLSILEPEDHKVYHMAHKHAIENDEVDCEEMFPQCRFSLLEFALNVLNKR